MHRTPSSPSAIYIHEIILRRAASCHLTAHLGDQWERPIVVHQRRPKEAWTDAITTSIFMNLFTAQLLLWPAKLDSAASSFPKDEWERKHIISRLKASIFAPQQQIYCNAFAKAQQNGRTVHPIPQKVNRKIALFQTLFPAHHDYFPSSTWQQLNNPYSLFSHRQG